MAHHRNAREYLCTQCPKAFNTKADLSQHSWTHNKSSVPISCEICNLNFTMLNKYTAHMKIHQPREDLKKKGPQICNICNKEFVELSTHIKIVHEKVRDFECQICHLKFGKRSGLNRHIDVVHEKKKPYSCDICLKSFGENAGLMRHKKLHVLDEISAVDRNPRLQDPNYCHFCKTIEIDITLHYDEKHSDLQYSCDICHRRFKLASSINRHKRNIHSNETQFICDLCPYKNVLKGKEYLKKHMEKHMRSREEAENQIEILEEDIIYESPMKKKQKVENEDDYNIVELKLEQHESYELEDHDSIKYEDQEMNVEYVYENTEEFVVEILRTNSKEEESIIEYEEFENEDTVTKLRNESQIKKKSMITQTRVQPQDTSELRKMKVEEKLSFKPKFKCKICQQNFTFESSRNRHMKMAHKELACNSCEESFTSFEEVKDHIVVHHKEEIDENLEQEISDKFIQKVTCKECNKFFMNSNCLNNHIQEVHTKTKFECEVCNKAFSFESSKNRHVKVAHEKNFDHRCEKCDREFGTKSELREHVFRYHTDYNSKKIANPMKVSNIIITKDDINRRKCNYCGKHFAKIQFLNLHIKAVHEKICFECEFCSKTFSFESSKIRHVRSVHQNIRDFKCDVCDDRCFSQSDQLKEHIMRYHTENPELFECELCDSNFISKKVLNAHHRNVHEKKYKPEKSFKPRYNIKCKYCSEAIETRHHLSKHILFVHENGTKPLRTCQMCDLSFKVFIDYEAHMKSEHGSNICMHCGLEFVCEDDLKSHNSSIHGRTILEDAKKYECDICGHRIFTKTQTMVHMRKHTGETPFICELCGKSFQFQSAFSYHKMMHTKTKKHSCSFCSKLFYTKAELIVHERIHTNEKPYKCEICGRSFRGKVNLNLHHQTHESTRKYFNCDICNIAFDKKNSLKSHNIEFHKEIFPHVCCDCGDCFKVEFFYKRHMNTKHGKFFEDSRNDDIEEIEYLHEYRNYI
jgi:KRAB domain-containing zinc finger protein